MDSQDLKENPILLNISLAKWRSFMICIEYFNFCLMIGSLGTPRWVKQGSRSNLWRGGLLRCGGCSGDWEDEYYYSILQSCKENDVKGYKETFDSLSKAGFLYLSFEILALLVFSLLLLAQSGLVFRLFGDKCKSKLLLLILGLHSIAIILWFSISKVKLAENCSFSSNYFKSHPICATQGPTLALVIEFLCFVTFGVNKLVRIKLNQVHSEQSTSRMEIGVVNTS
jgi:hypothetical protein